MERNASVDLYRCLCMLGVVCIHTFTAARPVSHSLWALCCPFLIGFVMISGWFGIHFKWVKLVRLFGIIVVCSVIWAVIRGNYSPMQFYGKGYWYIWAYIFVMMLSPLIDGFIEQCADRSKLLRLFASVGVMLWGWSFFAQNAPRFVPTVSGFGDTSGVILLLIYILTRVIRQLGWEDWLGDRKYFTVGMMVLSGIIVALGFRHNNSIFAFTFAFSILVLINRMTLPRWLSRAIIFIAPSVFSVYLLHMPMMGYMTGWCDFLQGLTRLPHPLCQFILAILIFFGCVLADLPRRIAVRLMAARPKSAPYRCNEPK